MSRGAYGEELHVNEEKIVTGSNQYQKGYLGPVDCLNQEHSFNLITRVLERKYEAIALD